MINFIRDGLRAIENIEPLHEVDSNLLEVEETLRIIASIGVFC